MTDRELGANQERRRILAVIESERAIWYLTGNTRIATALDALAAKVELDHAEDNER